MMGRQTGDQSQLFYLFNLEQRIPAGHLLRRINPVVTRVLADQREKLAPSIARSAALSSVIVTASALSGGCAKRSILLSRSTRAELGISS